MLKQLIGLGLLFLLSVPASAEKIAISSSDIKLQAKVTFIELGSVRCFPCKMMQPVMAEIEKEYPDKVAVIFYDVWTKEGSAYGQKYSVRVIPTQIFLDQTGKEYFRHEGFFPKDALVKTLQQEIK